MLHPRIGALFLDAGEYGSHLDPKREVFLAFVRGQLVQLAEVAHACQVGGNAPACERLPSVAAGRGIAVEYSNPGTVPVAVTGAPMETSGLGVLFVP